VDGHAWGVGGHEDDGLLLVLVWVGWVGLCHHDVDLAAWVTGTGGPPFLECC
jgi:hypothetical protein